MAITVEEFRKLNLTAGEFAFLGLSVARWNQITYNQLVKIIQKRTKQLASKSQSAHLSSSDIIKIVDILVTVVMFLSNVLSDYEAKSELSAPQTISSDIQAMHESIHELSDTLDALNDILKKNGIPSDGNTEIQDPKSKDND